MPPHVEVPTGCQLDQFAGLDRGCRLLIGEYRRAETEAPGYREVGDAGTKCDGDSTARRARRREPCLQVSLRSKSMRRARSRAAAVGTSGEPPCRQGKPLRSATISLGGQQVTAPPQIPDDPQRILDALTASRH